jgi:hypothetical protein
MADGKPEIFSSVHGELRAAGFAAAGPRAGGKRMSAAYSPSPATQESGEGAGG